MSKEVILNLDTPMEVLQKTIESFKGPDLVKYNREENQFLLNICKKEVKNYQKLVVKDLKKLKISILKNKVIKTLYTTDLTNVYKSSYRIMSLEKEGFTRLKNLLKEKDLDYNNGAYFYCVYLGLIKSHIDTNNYLGDKLEEAVPKDYGFIPNEGRNLPSDSFHETIKNAIDDLSEKSSKTKCK